MAACNTGRAHSGVAAKAWASPGSGNTMLPSSVSSTSTGSGIDSPGAACALLSNTCTCARCGNSLIRFARDPTQRSRTLALRNIVTTVGDTESYSFHRAVRNSSTCDVRRIPPNLAASAGSSTTLPLYQDSTLLIPCAVWSIDHLFREIWQCRTRSIHRLALPTTQYIVDWTGKTRVHRDRATL
jgi:hypothetical protein